MNSSVLIFIIYRLANILEFITGYFFMKCMDCTMKRRKGKLPSWTASLHHSFYPCRIPQRHDKYFLCPALIRSGKLYAL